jgi:hypothetical protein
MRCTAQHHQTKFVTEPIDAGTTGRESRQMRVQIHTHAMKLQGWQMIVSAALPIAALH